MRDKTLQSGDYFVSLKANVEMLYNNAIFKLELRLNDSITLNQLKFRILDPKIKASGLMKALVIIWADQFSHFDCKDG